MIPLCDKFNTFTRLLVDHYVNHKLYSDIRNNRTFEIFTVEKISWHIKVEIHNEKSVF